MSINLFIFFVVTFISLTLMSATIDGKTGLAATTLTAAVAKSDETITVQSTSGFGSSGVIMIDDETICYGGVTGSTFTDLTRGCRDSGAARHGLADGDVKRRVYSQGPGLLNTLVGFDIAESFSDGGISGMVTGIWNTASNLPNFMQAVAKMIMWDYGYLEGPYIYFKYLLYGLSAGMVMSFIRLALGR